MWARPVLPVRQIENTAHTLHNPVRPRVYRGIRVCVVGWMFRPRTRSPTWNRGQRDVLFLAGRSEEQFRATAGVIAGVAFTAAGSA